MFPALRTVKNKVRSIRWYLRPVRHRPAGISNQAKEFGFDVNLKSRVIPGS